MVSLTFMIFVALAEHPLFEAQLVRLDLTFAHSVWDYSLLVNPESLSLYLFDSELP